MSLGCDIHSSHCVKAIGVLVRQWQLWAQQGCWYIHIAWGFLSLFVSFAQAISQEPQTMKRATVQGFTLSFCLYITLVETRGCCSPRP